MKTCPPQKKQQFRLKQKKTDLQQGRRMEDPSTTMLKGRQG